MITDTIYELIQYGIEKKLIEEDDRIYTANRLLELFGLEGTEKAECKKAREVYLILKDLTDYAVANKMIEDDTVTERDLFDTKVMGVITPMPSAVRKEFKRLYEK